MLSVRFIGNVLGIAFGAVLVFTAVPAEASHNKSKHHKHHHSHHSHHHHKHHHHSSGSDRTDSLEDFMLRPI